VVVAAIFKSVPELANVALVSGVIWIIFGILGMQLFLGKFVRCSDPAVTTKAECVGQMATTQLRLREWMPPEGAVGEWGCSDPSVTLRDACVGPYDDVQWLQREWIKEPMNFDNIGVTMRTLFEMCTTEGYARLEPWVVKTPLARLRPRCELAALRLQRAPRLMRVGRILLRRGGAAERQTAHVRERRAARTRQ
jgi:hypothetical protein